MSEKLYKAGQSLTRAYKKFDDFAQKGLITTLKEKFKGKTPISTGPVLSKSKAVTVFDPKKALPSKLPSAAKKVGKLGTLKKVGRIASRVALPVAAGFEAANLAYKVATLSPEKKAKVKKLKTTLKKKSTKQQHADLLKMRSGGDTMGLKAIPPGKEKSLGKLPTKVRNKMGFEKDGGMMKARVGRSIETAGSKRAKYENERKTLINKLRGAQIGPVEEARLSEKGNQAMRDALREKKMMKARVGKSIERKKSNLVKKTPIKDFIKNTIEGKYVDSNKGTAESSDMILNKRKITKRNIGGEMRGYGAARTSGMGLQDEQLVPGKSLDYYKDLM